MNTTETIKIIYSEDFKNSNKKTMIKDFYIAFTSENADFILEHVEHDVHWQIVDKALIVGKEMIAKKIKQMIKLKIRTLHIKNIIVNGRTGAVNGILHTEENKNYSFCDIYHFSNTGKNAKVQRISSYINNFSMEPTNVCIH